MRPRMTYDIAMACSKDEANRSMRRDGRSTWNENDWNILAQTFDRLYPVELELKQRSSPSGDL